jgi:hypothetical protein
LEFGASRTVLDYSSRTAEAYASEKGHFGIVNLISNWQYLPSRASPPATASPSATPSAAAASAQPVWAATPTPSPLSKNEETHEPASGEGKLKEIGTALENAQVGCTCSTW